MGSAPLASPFSTLARGKMARPFWYIIPLRLLLLLGNRGGEKANTLDSAAPLLLQAGSASSQPATSRCTTSRSPTSSSPPLLARKPRAPTTVRPAPPLCLHDAPPPHIVGQFPPQQFQPSSLRPGSPSTFFLDPGPVYQAFVMVSLRSFICAQMPWSCWGPPQAPGKGVRPAPFCIAPLRSPIFQNLKCPHSLPTPWIFDPILW